MDIGRVQWLNRPIEATNPASACQLAALLLRRVGPFGELLRLRSSAWDRPRTASRTSAAAGLARLVGRFAGAHHVAEDQAKPRSLSHSTLGKQIALD
eukprot:COSAG05_NODE_25_length_31349_cov_4.978560_12_plen_97_part_00